MFPPELERGAFRASNGEYGWTRAQISVVVEVLRSDQRQPGTAAKCAETTYTVTYPPLLSSSSSGNFICCNGDEPFKNFVGKKPALRRETNHISLFLHQSHLS